MEEKIVDFTYRPITEKKRAFPCLFALLAIAAALVILSAILLRYRGIVSLFAVIFLTAALYVFTRYILAEYTYSVVTDSEGISYFAVTRITGKRVSTLCSFRMSEITSIDKIEEGKTRHAPASKAQKYNFIPDFSIKEYYLIKTSSGTLNMEISIKGTDELAARLLEYAKIAKELAADDEEDY